MSKWLGQRFGKRKQKTRQLWEKEFNTDSLRSLIDRAVTDVEQIVASIKMKAQTEAEDEAARIIDQARKEADKIRRTAEIAAQKQVTKEAKASVREEAKRETKEAKKATGESDLGEEKVEEPARLEKEATVSEPVETITEELPEQRLSEEGPDKGKPISTSLKMDRQALYNGEVELAIAVPVDPAAVSKLYNHLQTTPEIKILYVRGSWDRGTTITVTLDKPLPLIDMISKIPGVEVVPELPQKDNLVKGTSSSLLGPKGKGATRIDLTLKEG